MGLFSLKKRKKEERTVEREPFEKREKVYPLVAYFTIVNRGQSRFYTDAYAKKGASLSMVLYAHSLPPENIVSLFGESSLRKDIVMTVCREDLVPELMQIAKQRFAISRQAKGIVFVCPIDSVSGISVYRFLADQNRELRLEEKNNGRK
jgi:hypothetical protein